VLGRYFVDFIVEDLVIVEIKSVEQMHPIFETQIINDIRLAEKRVGLLINFNSRLVRDGIERFIVEKKLRVFVSSVASHVRLPNSRML
jgi:GxxExxY protein